MDKLEMKEHNFLNIFADVSSMGDKYSAYLIDKSTNIHKKMKTIIIKNVEMPLFPPKGWKKKVAQAAGCSEKTVYNALRGGIRGPQANKVFEAYKQVCGENPTIEIVDK